MPRSLVQQLRLIAMLVSAFGCTAGPEGDRPRADYDKETGVLTRLAYDLNKNGTNDAVGHMDGTRVLRIDLDLDENGSVDRWDFYGSDQTIEKVGFSSENDGVMDAQAFYQPAGSLPAGDLDPPRRAVRQDRVL